MIHFSAGLTEKEVQWLKDEMGEYRGSTPESDDHKRTRKMFYNLFSFVLESKETE